MILERLREVLILCLLIPLIYTCNSMMFPTIAIQTVYNRCRSLISMMNIITIAVKHN